MSLTLEVVGTRGSISDSVVEHRSSVYQTQAQDQSPVLKQVSKQKNKKYEYWEVSIAKTQARVGIPALFQ